MWFRKYLSPVTKGLFVLGCAAAFALAGTSRVIADDDKKGADGGDKKESGGKDGKGKDGEGDKEEKKRGGIGSFLPIGLANEGVIIPSFDDGIRTSLIKADIMTRVDEDHLEMDNLVIENFALDGSVDSKITTLRARYHMPTSVLSSRSRSRVERADFEIEGDRLVFDTETQRGRMAGNVEMVIFDVKSFGAGQGIMGVGEADPAPDGEKKPDGEKGAGGDE